MNQLNEVTASLIGAQIKSATSSLKNFSVELADGRGVSIEATMDGSRPTIQLKIVPSSELPAPTEAVCSVDWSWIYGSAVKKITASSNAVQFHLDSVGPLSVGVGVWQGSPFLSFQPYKAPAK